MKAPRPILMEHPKGAQSGASRRLWRAAGRARGGPGPAPSSFRRSFPAPPRWRPRRPERSRAMTMLAPPGTLERRHALAARVARACARRRVRRAGAEGQGRLAPCRGTARLRLRGRGDRRAPSSHLRRERAAPLAGIDDALDEGEPRFVDALGLWSQPGNLQLESRRSRQRAARGPPAAAGRARRRSRLRRRRSLDRCARLARRYREIGLIDIDRRAIEAARRNVKDPARIFLGRRAAAGRGSRGP